MFQRTTTISRKKERVLKFYSRIVLRIKKLSCIYVVTFDPYLYSLTEKSRLSDAREHDTHVPYPTEARARLRAAREWGGASTNRSAAALRSHQRILLLCTALSLYRTPILREHGSNVRQERIEFFRDPYSSLRSF